MRIPFSNRTADVDLPAVQGQPQVTVKAVLDAFRDQVPRNFETLFEAFVLLSPRKVRITCRSLRALEEASPGPCLSEFPRDLSSLPHWVNVFYPGQTPTCFACRQSGQTRANCPKATAPVVPAENAAADETVWPLLSSARNDIKNALMGRVVDRVVDHTHAIPPQPPLSFAEATQRGLDVPFDAYLPINDDGPGGLNISDGGQNPTTALADDVPNIIDEDHSGLKINDDGHHKATTVVFNDLKINDEGHCGPKIADEDHRPITVKKGTALGPHVSGADNSSTDLTDEDVSLVDDGDEADDNDDDDDGAGNLVVYNEHYTKTRKRLLTLFSPQSVHDLLVAGLITAMTLHINYVNAVNRLTSSY